MSPETSFNWNIIIAFGTIIIAITTVFQVGATLLVAYYVNKFSKNAERISNARSTNQQWQGLNLLALESREFRETLAAMNYGTGSPDAIRKIYVIFYILNILYDVFYAKNEDRIIAGFADKMTKDHIRLLMNSEAELKYILDGHRGYDLAFVTRIKGVMEEIRAENSS